MCIVVVSSLIRRFSLIEQVWLGVSPDGHVQSEQVYDIFFRSPATRDVSRLRDIRAILLHPHHLLGADRTLCVRSDPAPGSGNSPFDRLYVVKCSLTEGVFTAPLASAGDHGFPQVVPNRGKVVVAAPTIPQAILNSPEAMEVLVNPAFPGTVFEVAFGDLEPDKDYATRLVIKPVGMRHPLSRVARLRADGSESGQWEQACEIRSAARLDQSMLDWLDQIPDNASARAGAALLKKLIVGPHDLDAPQKPAWCHKHRLFLVFPPECWCVSRTAVGRVTSLRPRQYDDATEGRRFNVYEWMAGSDSHHDEDPFWVARMIVNEFSQAPEQARTAQQLSRSLRLSEGKIGPVIDFLCSRNILRRGSNHGLTRGREWQLLKEARSEMWEQLARCDGFHRNFLVNGFNIQYSIHYEYESLPLRRRRLAERHQRIILLVASVLSLLLSMVSLALSLGLLSRPLPHGHEGDAGPAPLGGRAEPEPRNKIDNANSHPGG